MKLFFSLKYKTLLFNNSSATIHWDDWIDLIDWIDWIELLEDSLDTIGVIIFIVIQALFMMGLTRLGGNFYQMHINRQHTRRRNNSSISYSDPDNVPHRILLPSGRYACFYAIFTNDLYTAISPPIEAGLYIAWLTRWNHALVLQDLAHLLEFYKSLRTYASTEIGQPWRGRAEIFPSIHSGRIYTRNSISEEERFIFMTKLYADSLLIVNKIELDMASINRMQNR